MDKKKILGFLLLIVPIVIIFCAMTLVFGLNAALLVFGIIALVISMFIGAHLLFIGPI